MKILKFLIAGGSAALLELLVFVALSYFLGSDLLLVSQTVSFLCGFVLSFILQKVWVFESKSGAKSELLKYAILAGINLVMSNLMLVVLVDLLDMHYIFGKILVMAAVATWNYFIFQKLIFSK